MGYSLGVDLGTTFVGAALVAEAKPEMVTLGGRAVVVPSVVYLGDDGRLLCGEAAQRRSIREPARAAREFKRRLGDPVPVRLGDQTRPATDLLAVLLIEALRVVTETEGESPERVVLTHPANWGRFRCGRLEEVGRLAGLDDVLLMSEPVAAASHYTRTRAPADGRVVAVYDLGGGTFDVTVLRVAGGRMEILGEPEGIERLGGVDFDEALYAHVDHVTDGALSALDHRDPQAAAALARVRQECAVAKEGLSTDRKAVIPVFLPDRNLEIRVSRSEFEDLIRVHVESTVGALERTLRSAGVAHDDVDSVLLVGGSSRIPLVSRMITEAIGRPTLVDTHPKYAVALGAAALAAEAGSGGGAAPATPLPAAPRAVLPPAAALPAPRPPAPRPPGVPPPPAVAPPVAVPPVARRSGAPRTPAEVAPLPRRPRPPAPAVLRVHAEGRELSLRPGRRCVIGRGDDVELELTDPRISRHHAEIAALDGTWAYTDTSRNGTYLDGRPVRRVEIAGPTALLLGDAATGVRLELRPEPAPAGGPEAELVGLIDRGDRPTGLHELARDRLRIGRQADNDVVLDDLMVSRKHAELLRSDGGWTILDVGSGNGTFVNGRRIGVPTPVGADDVIRVGQSLLQLDGDRLVERVDHGDRGRPGLPLRPQHR